MITDSVLLFIGELYIIIIIIRDLRPDNGALQCEAVKKSTVRHYRLNY